MTDTEIIVFYRGVRRNQVNLEAKQRESKPKEPPQVVIQLSGNREAALKLLKQLYYDGVQGHSVVMDEKRLRLTLTVKESTDE